MPEPTPDLISAARDLQETNGLDEQTALHYMSLIGEAPEVDLDGKTVVRDRLGTELARVKMPEKKPAVLEPGARAGQIP